MSLVLTIFFFIVLLSFLVLIHEAGHFLAAKLFGVKVHEFGLGYPPLAKNLFSKWGTQFTLNWLPFGGFVRLAGEERYQGEQADASKLHKSEMFYAKKVWQKLIIILAGASINFIFGIIAFSILFTFLGIPQTFGVIITEVAPESPAQSAGLQPESRVTAVFENDTRYEIVNVDDFIEEVGGRAGQTIELEVEKDGQVSVLPMYVRQPTEIPEGQGAIGVAITPETFEFVKYTWWQMPFRGAWFGLQEALRFGWEILRALGTMVRDLFFAGVVPQDVGGPVRIVYEAQKANLLREGPLAILNFAAILSINLAMVNVLPIPALDGGRAVFIVLEGLLGKRFKPSYEQYGNALGMMALLTLIIMISFRDVGLIFADQGIGFGSVLSLLKGLGNN